MTASPATPKKACSGEETIFALASGSLPAAIAVLRISGPASPAILPWLAGCLPPPRHARLVTLRQPAHPLAQSANPQADIASEANPSGSLPTNLAPGAIIDQALALFFPAPHSFSGEDMVELHIHGSRAVVTLLLQLLASQAALRPAEPGEFTRRAFMNARLDFIAAEGLGDLIAAETTAQHQQATAQLTGQHSKRLEKWRRDLLNLHAHIEAQLDFPEESQDEAQSPAPPLLSPRHPPSAISDAHHENLSAAQTSWTHDLETLGSEIASAIGEITHGRRLRSGTRIALVGEPNAGKSTLLNALAERSAALVSPHAGTTRDVIEAHLDLGGFPVILADTAGLRALPPAKPQSADHQPDPSDLEGLGIAQAQEWMRGADLFLHVTHGGDPNPAALTQELQRLAPRTAIWRIVNKIDLYPTPLRPTPLRPTPLRQSDRNTQESHISALHGTGLGELRARIDRWLSEQPRPATAFNRLRHRQILSDLLGHLSQARQQSDLLLIAEELRLASRCLSRLLGRIDVEDLLDQLFSHFCIGK